MQVVQAKKRVLAGVLSGVLLLGACPSAWAAHYNDASSSSEWQAWLDSWKTTAADFTKVSLSPGADDTELKFAWYDKADGKATPIVHFGTDKNKLQSYQGTSAKVDASLTGDTAYAYNHVTVSGLKENTSYYYTVEKNGVQTAVQTYKTGSFENVKILLVGDPQIGASKGQSQDGKTLVADSGVANTAACNDSFNWNRTLQIAAAQNPGLNFIISAGDQVNKTGKPKEEEYAGFLSAEVLVGLPIATTIGNHDSLNADYSYHFDNPNATSNGKTQAGGDYYYSYGSGLFIVLNTNNYNVAEHQATLRAAVASDPDAKWRIVTMHQDVYGSGLDHSDTDGMILRTQLTPAFDQYNIDVVLQGHDHTYSRSKLLYSDGQTHGKYEFQLNADKSDYDWDNAYNTTTNSKIPLAPKDTDTAGKTALNAFVADNRCYNIESTTGNTVVNPKGILYIETSSATGSKFYELIGSQQDYIAARRQSWLPCYSVISMDESSFSIDTYEITAEGKTEKVDSTFTIQKDGTAAAADGSLTRAEAILRMYAAAGAPAATASASFADVSSSDACYKALEWAMQDGIVVGVSKTRFQPDEKITRGQLAVLLYRYAKANHKTVSVDGKKAAAYADAGEMKPWALDAMRFSVNDGLLLGTKLAPKGTVTASDMDYALTKLGEKQ